MRRSTVLSLPPQLVFPGLTIFKKSQNLSLRPPYSKNMCEDQIFLWKGRCKRRLNLNFEVYFAATHPNSYDCQFWREVL
jgi:hypothetical protein